jgi:hypothetical protein
LIELMLALAIQFSRSRSDSVGLIDSADRAADEGCALKAEQRAMNFLLVID